EVMITTPAIRNLIRESKTYQIPNMIQTGAKLGMKSMDQELVNLFRQGKISRESVLSRCSDFEYTNRLIGGVY
ncbi:MAG: type IV pili twitching motility protein PilT, partial [Paeniclostridium sordellii]|nr:type IV pili twitching motility protein PilT [Paeniclostridium sordellii]